MHTHDACSNSHSYSQSPDRPTGVTLREKGASGQPTRNTCECWSVLELSVRQSINPRELAESLETSSKAQEQQLGQGHRAWIKIQVHTLPTGWHGWDGGKGHWEQQSWYPDHAIVQNPWGGFLLWAWRQCMQVQTHAIPLTCPEMTSLKQCSWPTVQMMSYYNCLGDCATFVKWGFSEGGHCQSVPSS